VKKQAQEKQNHDSFSKYMDGKSSFSQSINNDKKSSSSSSFYSSDDEDNLQNTPTEAAVGNKSTSEKQSF
jgi:hypothetical protein